MLLVTIYTEVVSYSVLEFDRPVSRQETYTFYVPLYAQQFQCCAGYMAGSNGTCERMLHIQV